MLFCDVLIKTIVDLDFVCLPFKLIEGGLAMMENERFWPYWAATKRLVVVLALICFGGITLGLIFSHLLDEFRLFGFPLGVLLTGQFLVLLCIGIVFWFTGFQDHTDTHYGADEDL